MQDQLTNFYLDQEEPLRGTLLALHDYLLALHPAMSVAWKWSAPFFLYKGKTFCYLWIDKKTKNPYIGIVDGGLIEHPLLELGNRKRMKVLPIDPEEDFPLEAMEQIFGEALEICANRGK